MDLPYEILVYLFQYLPKSDRKAASETCRSWYVASNDYNFLKNKVLIIYKAPLDDESLSPLQICENSSFTFFNYLFNEVEINSKVSKFWDTLGEHVKSLTLKNCDICEKVFIYMLKKCKDLESLSIQNCKDLFMSGRLLEGQSDGLTVDSLKKLKRLSLSENQYLTDALVSRFLMSAPSLEEIDVSACSLQFHQGLIKKFYPGNTQVVQSPSESVFTFYFILNYITTKASSVKHLMFSKTLIDGTALKSLSEVPDLQLEYLELNSCEQLTNTGLLALTITQTSLKELDIGLCNRVTDQSLVHICNNLVNLECLNIQRCRAVTDLGISELIKLKKLRTLNISQCEQITKDGIEKGICSEENGVLKELILSSLNLDQTGLIMISEKLPKLQVLDISYCFNAVTDISVQLLFKNQVFLKVLKMSHCDKVSDAGLTGMGKVDSDNENDGGISLYKESDQFKINLGSRAEEEIVRDARRKLDVMRMCEKLTLTDTFSGFSLARLRNLQVLDISGCNKITDVSLTYAFKFKELYNLNLSRCQQITHGGLQHLVKHCPSIEYFNLIDCYNLKDEAIKEIVEGLSRLQELQLRGCNQLTDLALNHIKMYCKKLKFLDLQGCRNITPELACSIGSLRTLHTVLISKPGPYLNDEGVKQRSPATTFLPALLRKLRLN